jgi:hypothetical protein
MIGQRCSETVRQPEDAVSCVSSGQKVVCGLTEPTDLLTRWPRARMCET